MEALKEGLPQQGEDVYIGWYGLSIGELFRYTWAIDLEYFFSIDSALMIASKGGFNKNILDNTGIRTKLKYLNTINSILEKANSPQSSEGELSM